MALELLLALVGGYYSNFWVNGTDDYLGDVISTLVPDARDYLQPVQDLNGLQNWLDTVYRKGYASLQPQDAFDSPAAKIVEGSVITIISPSGEVLAQSPHNAGGSYTVVSKSVVKNALAGDSKISSLYATEANGDYWMAVPIFQKNHTQPVLGALLISLEPIPLRGSQQWIDLVGLILLAGILMMVAIAPLGAIFGFIFSRGLTGRLERLTTAAEAWGEGNFQLLPPVDNSPDEIGRLGVKMREMAERISNLLQDQKALVQMEERNRLAQELHDTVRQQNFATLMQIRAARNQLTRQPEAAEKALLEAESLLKNTQTQLAQLISELRPPELEGKGLAEALQEFTQKWSQQACIPLDYRESGRRQLPFEIEKALFRVSQEALSNVLRHSRATAVTVSLIHSQQEAKLIIQDNGVGFDQTKKGKAGFGLSSMQQRMKEIGGELVVESSPEAGTQIIASVALAPLLPSTSGRKL